MKKVLSFGLIVAAVGLFSFADNVEKDKKKKWKEIHYLAPDPIKTDEFWMTFGDMHSQEDFFQTNCSMLNKTNDLMVVHWDEIEYTAAGNTVTGKDKKVVIKPGQTKKMIIRSVGLAGLPAETVDVSFKGIYLMSTDEAGVIALEDYPLPDTKKEVKTGDLKVAMKKLKKVTDVTDARFTVTNVGGDPILMNPGFVTATADGDDQNWPSDVRSNGYKVIWPGKPANLKSVFKIPASSADMQFANMLVKWNNSFIQSKEVKLPDADIKFEIDLTNSK